jgi:predicted DNA-binding transcriptional regulator YafY
MSTRTTQRATRLNDLRDYLLTVTKPLSQADLARHFGVSRATMSRMIPQLEDQMQIVLKRSADGKLSIDKERYLNHVRLSRDESAVVFLAVRLFARYADKPNPHAVSTLRSLSIALRKIAPRIADHIARTSEKLDRPMSDTAREHLNALEVLTRAWAEGTRVRLFTREEPLVERLFEPYFIEPSAVGYSSYVIGYDHYRHAERTFKIERLHRVLPTCDTYSVPATFDPYAKLAGAWGVNWGDGQTPVEVVLRFAAGRAADRVRETNWHESQVIEALPDGGCVMRIRVGSTQEMKPWIRQWGHECEVLAPAALRREIGDEMRKAGALYDESLNPIELDKEI